MLRAIAVASDTSDVVGTVDLACEPEGLLLKLVRVSAHAAGYVPTGNVRDQRVVIPYSSIRAVSDDGETLRIELEAPRVPYKHLMLAHVTRDDRFDHASLFRKRFGFQSLATAGSAAVLAGFLSLVQAPAFASALVAFAGALGAVWIGKEVSHASLIGGEKSAAERRLLFQQLRSRMAADRVTDLVPATPFATGPVAPAMRGAVSAKDEEVEDRWRELAPTLLPVGAGALAVLALIAITPRLLSPQREVGDSEPEDPLLSDRARLAALASASASQSAAASALPTPTVDEALPSCLCQAPDSPIFASRLPKVSLLPAVKRLNTNPNRPSLDLEIAAVNNSSRPIRELRGTATFLYPNAKRPEAPLRIGNERGIYYEGPLAPGAAIKWRIKGRGTSFRIATNADESIADSELATSDAFAQLLSAHTRSVKLHGAAMLARARDERARDAISKLREGARDEENAFLDAISRASAPIYACDLEVVPEGSSAKVSACVMNTTEEQAGPLEAKLLLSRGPVPSAVPKAPSADPESGAGIVAAHSIRNKISIPAKNGVRIEAKIPLDGSISDLLKEVIVE
ncbi:MAG: hypothetical protein U0165_07825 [Polyangiaceae bacterium]